MSRHTVQRAACLLAVITVIWAEKGQTRWSRQISTYTADISDWVPLPGPVEQDVTTTKRQAIAEPRILSEPFPGFARPLGFNHGGFNQDPFPSRPFFNSPANKQLYLHSLPAVPSAPQNFLNEQGFGQGIRFGLSQPNFPLNQAFVSQQFNFDNIPQIKPKPQQLSLNPQIKYENAQKTSQSSKPLQSYINQTPILKPELPKDYVGYHVQNISNDFNSKRPQSLQKLKYDALKMETDAKPKPKVEREEVQLLYVPLESLNSGQFNFRNPIATPQIINTDLLGQIPKQVPINTSVNKPSVNFQNHLTKPIENLNTRQEFLTNLNSQTTTFDQIPKFSTISPPFPTVLPTTAKPKKLKAHQPPLAIFLTQEARKNEQVKVGDVLYSLKNADTIAVLDAVDPQSAPKVFIGPSTLIPPENYVKFELPYLSNIENSEKKLRQLPFFVAPLSYNTPQGFAKIPFPSPHVGSVVINSQISKNIPSSPSSDIPSSFYTYNPSPPRTDLSIVTQKPNINYYSTASPKPKDSVIYEPNYYSFEQQTVNPLRVQKEETGVKSTSYFLSSVGNGYNPANFISFPSVSNYQKPEVIQTYTNRPTARTISTQKPTPPTSTTTTTTTTKPSTFSSQLLQTHNPYSINQAFHFSTPVDYQNFFDEYKENYASPNQALPPQQQASTNDSSSNIENVSRETEKTQIKFSQGTPNYLQGYTPEIHYESEVPDSRFTNIKTNQQTPQSQETYKYSENINSFGQNEEKQLSTPVFPPRNLSEQTESVTFLAQENLRDNLPSTATENSIPVTGPTNTYNQYNMDLNTGNTEEPTQSSSTTTPTSRRTPLRTRNRPRYTVKPDVGDYATKSIITRRPLRERRPLASRTRYEPNKITTEKALRNPPEIIETTTKYIRTKTRGRVHYKPSDADEIQDKRWNTQNNKENDLAYQRDVLHQNYPVTLMERTSTVDIEAITEPTIKVASTSFNQSEDTENAYSYEKLSITEHPVTTENKDDIQEQHTDTSIKDNYVPNVQSTQNNETFYEINSNIATGYTEQMHEEIKDQLLEVTAPSGVDIVTEENEQRSPATDKFDFIKQEEITTQQNIEKANFSIEEENQQSNQEENVVQTTPSYNRVRVRPGVIRKYHPASTEATRVKVGRRRPGQAVTYRPAFDRRRTTMRIDEIEADLKTKQIHSRPEFQDYRHPVYKPEPSTEPSITTSSTQEATKRGSYRRRRPSYTASSTETPTTTKKPYEIKNRFRGRRPTEKPTVKPETLTESTTSIASSTPVNKYNDRPRLSERFNKNAMPEETQDQDLNYSIRRPNYAAPESDRWSPKISTDSFKPFNPNDIVDEEKIPNVEQQSTNGHELDIITAKNEYDNILISVTPATNNRLNKKIPDIPPTLEALVEQSRITKVEGGDTMSTFESMLEEVMKNLEEQDEDEYTKNVMKHKGGEIGEIPPEKIILSEDSYSKATTPFQEDTSTIRTSEEVEQMTEKEPDRKSRRRGFWKKVKVRPATESIELAESQYYPNTVNRVGEPINLLKSTHDKTDKYDKSKLAVTTYKPTYQFIKELFETDNEDMEITPHIDIPKITVKAENQPQTFQSTTVVHKTKESTEKFNPGEMDLGTGTPDPTYSDNAYFSTATETITSTRAHPTVDRSDGFSLMDYFFGITSPDSDIDVKVKNESKRDQFDVLKTSSETNAIFTTEQSKSKVTTETTYIPDEITTIKFNEEERTDEEIDNVADSNKVTTAPTPTHIETSSLSSFMDSLKVVSTSMSTEISHETEICFRGKCIKTRKPTS